MTRARRLLARAALAVTAPLLALALLEALCRLAGLGHPTRFLLPADRDGTPVWIDNQLFGYRFFAPAVSRAPAPISVPRTKAPGELRIVLLGESAAMGEPEPAYGPARVLETLLAARHPDRTVRVINAAMTAINSHVIAEIARDLPRLQPDAVILYIGNNEVVGPFGPGTVFDPPAAAPSLNRLRVLLSRLRLVSAARAAAARRAGDAIRWKGMEMFAEQRVTPDDSRLDAVHASLSANLRRIIASAEHAGATVLLNTIAVNLADQAPLDGSPAPPPGASLADLVAVRDADTLRFRADSAINTLLRDTARTHPHLLFADAESAFAADGPPGQFLFIDHVHVTWNGSLALARLWADTLAPALPPPAPDAPALTDLDLATRLVWNPYNALDLAEIMAERAARPPFDTTADAAARRDHWARTLADLHAQLADLPLDTVLARTRDALARRPDDPDLHRMAALALLVEDRFQDAGEHLYALHRLLPHRADVRGWMAVLAALAARYDRIWPIMTDGAPDLGELPADALVGAAETLFAAGYTDASRAVLDIAAARFPHRLRLQTLAASRRAQTGDAAGALARLRDLHARHPEAPWIAEELGLLYALTGQAEAAREHLASLLAARDLESRLKAIQLLRFLGDQPAADAALDALLRDAPDHGDAHRAAIARARQRGDLATALAHLETLTTLEPWNGIAWGEQADLYDLRDRPRDAVAAYREAIPRLADPTGALRSLAWLLATEADPAVRDPEAALAATETLRRRERTPSGYTDLVEAAALAARGNPAAATDLLNAALRRPEVAADLDLADQISRARILFARGDPIRRERRAAPPAPDHSPVAPR